MSTVERAHNDDDERDHDDPMRPLANILAAPLSLADLVDHLPDPSRTAVDATLLHDFDAAWRDFMRTAEIQGTLPRGVREDHIFQLQAAAEEMEESKVSLQQELEQQATRMQDRLEALEDTATGSMAKAMGLQEQKHAHQSRDLDAVAKADTLQSQTLPWYHFLEQLQNQLDSTDLESTKAAATAEGSKSSSGRPSARARFLAHASSGHSQDTETSHDVLKAYSIDHALLSTHIAMLKRELDRSDQWMRSTDLAGKFLTEHNVWGLLKDHGDGGTDSAAAAPAIVVPLPYAPGTSRDPPAQHSSGAGGGDQDDQTATTEATTLASRG